VVRVCTAQSREAHSIGSASLDSPIHTRTALCSTHTHSTVQYTHAPWANMLP